MNFLDLEKWHRHEHFAFFRDFDNPYFNVTVPVDVTALMRLVRSREGVSSFLSYLFLSLKAANAVEEFRYRIRGDRVLVHGTIHGGSTILLKDERFAFGYFDYFEDFERFHTEASEEIAKIHAGDGRLAPRADTDDLIHYSVLPWMAFTSFSHARNWGQEDSVPKIVFGKHYEDGESIKMPVSVEVHHALMDGLHVGRFFEHFERDLAHPEEVLGL